MTTAHLQTKTLVKKYSKGISASALSREYKVSVWSIIARLRKAGVGIRSSKEQNARYLGDCTVEFTFREIVDGILLGDGQIDPKGILHLSQSNVRKGWLNQVKKHLTQVGCSSKFLPISPRVRFIEGRRVKSKPATLLYTPAYEEMQEERRRWYPWKLKTVPRDLRLTPLMLNHWFCGDGTHNAKGRLAICTNNFWEADVDFLVERMGLDLKVHSTKGATGRNGQFIVQFNRHDEAMKVKELLDLIIPRCCQYKMRFVRPKKRWGKFSDDQVREIRRRRGNGEPGTVLGKEFGASPQTIYRIAEKETYKHVE